MVRAHVFISGRVQGVFFRKHAQAEAGRLGLTGWVHNMVDGRVEAVCEGEEDKIQAFLAWCREGSPFSRVGDVKVSWEEYTGKEEVFHVRAFGF